MLKFIKIAGTREAAEIISDRIFKELDAGKKVLWLLSGGGNITIQVEAMKLLPEDLVQNLVIMFSDERYGSPGHKDSNYKQLLDAGFSPGKALLQPTLVEGDNSLFAARARYGKVLDTAINAADAVITQLGMGTDGHISGILPHSAATTATGIMFDYKSEEFDRITMTFESLRRSTVIYAFVFGAGKLEQLTKLHDQALPLDVQPAQFLKTMPESYVYNDQIEGE
ncbi:MAG TPA: 6-phosphogluconolactonase [Candidatus Saccharimonadales bacterium]|nr:6-phosphogluconolactonase [Candidatus Saccharimonadales bacterium]